VQQKKEYRGLALNGIEHIFFPPVTRAAGSCFPTQGPLHRRSEEERENLPHSHQLMSNYRAHHGSQSNYKLIK
jgi:hypothetical protein